MSGSVTFNTQPWADSDCEIWVTAGKITGWSFNGPQFCNNLTVDGFCVDFSGELPREDPFPLRDKIYGQGLSSNRQTSCRRPAVITLPPLWTP